MQIVGRSVGAALAMGNACVLKPAEEACLTVLAFARIAQEAGLPAGRAERRAGAGRGGRRGAVGAPRRRSTSRSPARSRPARWSRPRRRRTRCRSRSSSAARARRSCSPMPTSMRRCRSSSTPASRTPGRPARRRRASWSSGRCSTAVRRAHGRALPRAAHRPGAATTWTSGPVISPAPARHRRALPRARARQRPAASRRRPSSPATLPRGGHYVRADAARRRAEPTTRLAQQEIFGPVQVLIPFDGEAEALAHRQRHRRSAWSPASGPATAAAQLRMARALKCGQVFVNNYGAGGGVELPFGGVKLLGPRAREGLRGAVRLLGAEDDRDQHGSPRLTLQMRSIRIYTA